MDIKLKNNRKSINKIILAISICIAILPILLGLSQGCIEQFIGNNTYIYNKYVSNLVDGIPYKDGNENIREDAISKEITNIKDEYEYDNKSEDEYRKLAIKSINDKLIGSKIVSTPKNIEYYFEKQDGQIISNINEQSQDIINETKRESKDYIMFLDVTNASPKEIHVTNNMKLASEHLTHGTLVDYRLTDFKNLIIRISNPLIKGDELYSVVQEDTIANTIKYGTLLLFVLDICIIIILGLRFAKEKGIELKKTIILRLYNKLFIEIKVLTIVIMLTGLYYVISCWGHILIQDYITYIVDNAYLTHGITFYEQLFSLFIGTIIIGYLFMCDIYQLYLDKNSSRLTQYVYDKSMFRIICNSFKNSISNKSMTKRMMIFLIIIVLYLALIIWSTWLLSIEGFFDIIYMYELFYIIPPMISILATILIIMCIANFLTNIQKIKVVTDNIINGTYKNEIKIRGSFILKELANNIMNIDDGLDKAIGKAVKSEKMKGELITNVSHDLKTPLTSIINYVDLLDRDNVSEEKKKEYLGILKERSARLKVLIEDLFEASKAASGNLEIHMENLDPVALLRQTLGEFEDIISNSNLDFIKKIPENKLTIHADGKKTFRVFQNLISNILKYSLKGTRVYIDVEEKEKLVSITFKNISGYPLNFTEEEILERFKRGDSSRTTEGSGLGLSIAKSLVELQGGIFEIKLDGDLFKVIVLLQKQNF